jgi:hypothetical protein
MPPSAEDCRAKAIQCAELASKTRDRFSKRLLEQTAEQWNVLAVGAERYEEIHQKRDPAFAHKHPPASPLPRA